MPHALIGGITMEYDDTGHGNEALLLVHGHPFDRSMWAPQRDPLSRAGWRVITADLRGYGGSTVVPGTTTLAQFAHDLASLLDHLGVGPVSVAGLSMGGQIAMAFCEAFAPRVRGLALAATFPQAETAEGKVARNVMADRLLREGMTGYADEVLPFMVGASSLASKPEVGAHVLRMMRAAHPIGAAAALRGRALRPDYAAVLAALEVPALVVVGDQDAFTTRADAEAMHALLRNSELLWLERVGHMPNLERPAEFNDAMVRLLARVRGAERA